MIAFFLFIDGVHTVIALASTFAINLGLDTSSIIIALILVQFVAFPSTLMWAFIAEKYGDKLVINITIIIYIILILYSFNLSDGIEFYILAGLIGFIQGGIQGSSRSLFAKLIPSDKAGAFFGLFNTFGKAAAFIGPALIGIFLAIFKDTTFMLLPLLILFVLGIIVLYFVDTDEVI